MDKKLFNPKETAAILGVTVLTLQRWDNASIIRAVRTPTNRRMFPKSEIDRILGEVIPTTSNRTLAIYTRVSSNEQKMKGDLDRQTEFIKDNLDLKMYSDIIVISDVGSGLNDKRKGLIRLMEISKKNEITDLAIRYKDRLTIFGYNYLKIFFESFGIQIHILDESLNNKTVYEELTDDLLSIVTSFSGKLYGLRSGKNKVLRNKVEVAIKNVADLPNED